jgi:hypothetical protein
MPPVTRLTARARAAEAALTALDELGPEYGG